MSGLARITAGRRARGRRAGEQSEKPAAASERWATQSSASMVGRLRERREVIGALVAYDDAPFVVVELDVPERPQAAELLVNVGEAVGKEEEMGADVDLQVKVGKEEGTMFDLVMKGLIRVIVAKGVKVGGRVEVRREWSGEVERKVVPVGVLGAEVPDDALSGGQETVLADGD